MISRVRLMESLWIFVTSRSTEGLQDSLQGR